MDYFQKSQRNLSTMQWTVRERKKEWGRFLTKRSKMEILTKFCMLICQLQNLKEVSYLIGILSSKTLYGPKNIHQLDEIERDETWGRSFQILPHVFKSEIAAAKPLRPPYIWKDFWNVTDLWHFCENWLLWQRYGGQILIWRGIELWDNIKTNVEKYHK